MHTSSGKSVLSEFKYCHQLTHSGPPASTSASHRGTMSPISQSRKYPFLRALNRMGRGRRRIYPIQPESGWDSRTCKVVYNSPRGRDCLRKSCRCLIPYIKEILLVVEAYELLNAGSLLSEARSRAIQLLLVSLSWATGFHPVTKKRVDGRCSCFSGFMARGPLPYLILLLLSKTDYCCFGSCLTVLITKKKVFQCDALWSGL